MKKRTKIFAAICSTLCLVTSFASCGAGGLIDKVFGDGDSVVREDLVVERTFARCTPETTADSDFVYNVEYSMSDELSREILADENKVLTSARFNYSSYETFAKQGLSHGEVVESLIALSAEKNEQTVEERLSAWYENATQSFAADRIADEYGNIRSAARQAVGVPEGNTNTRYIILPFILTNNEGVISYEVGSFGERSYDDWEISPSAAYIAAECLNRIMGHDAPFSRVIWDYCMKAVQQGVAESRGLSANEWASVYFDVHRSEPIKMKVGETKKLNVECKDKVDFPVVYYSEYAVIPEQAGCFEVDTQGNIKALKAGIYQVDVVAAGTRFSYTLEITE